jgi:hypothetical protein
MTFKDWSAVAGTWVSIAAALLGGYFALNTYRTDVAKRADARVLQTFELFQHFGASDMLRIRTDILNRGQAADQDILAYIDFFDTVYVCVERDICDRALTEQLFAPYTRASIPGLAHWIVDTRAKERDLDLRPMGFGLEQLSGTEVAGILPREASPESTESAGTEATR